MTGRRRTRAPRNSLGCHDRALLLLAARPRSRRELELRLLRAGFPAEEVREELGRLAEVGLVDDEAFAAMIVEHEVGVRRAGRRAIASSLLAKGVARETVERSLAGVEGGEEDRAVALARARAVRLAGLDPAVALRRLISFLTRRGYDLDLARRAASTVLEVGSAEP